MARLTNGSTGPAIEAAKFIGEGVAVVAGPVSDAASNVADWITAPPSAEDQRQQQEREKEALINSALPENLLKSLSQPVEALGFRIDPQSRNILDLKRELVLHHRIPVTGGYIALLYFGEKLLGSDTYSRDILDKLFCFPNSGAIGLVVFSNVTKIADTYRNMADTFVNMTTLKSAYLVDSKEQLLFDSEDGQGKQRLVQKWMGLRGLTSTLRPESTSNLSNLRSNKEPARSEVRKVCDALANAASHAPSQQGVTGYLQYIIRDTNWPSKNPDWQSPRVQALKGIAKPDAQNLVHWALGKDGMVPGYEGYTVIGGLLEAIFRQDIEKEFLKEIVARYNLVPGGSLMRQ